MNKTQHWELYWMFHNPTFRVPESEVGYRQTLSVIFDDFVGNVGSIWERDSNEINWLPVFGYCFRKPAQEADAYKFAPPSPPPPDYRSTNNAHLGPGKFRFQVVDGEYKKKGKKRSRGRKILGQSSGN